MWHRYIQINYEFENYFNSYVECRAYTHLPNYAAFSVVMKPSVKSKIPIYLRRYIIGFERLYDCVDACTCYTVKSVITYKTGKIHKT